MNIWMNNEWTQNISLIIQFRSGGCSPFFFFFFCPFCFLSNLSNTLTFVVPLFNLSCVLLNIAEANIFHVCSFKSSGVCNQVYCPSVCDQEEESLLMSRGSHACPCVESIQGSSLLPVNVERKITLVGRNLHLYQVMQRLEACWSLIV